MCKQYLSEVSSKQRGSAVVIPLLPVLVTLPRAARMMGGASLSLWILASQLGVLWWDLK